MIEYNLLCLEDAQSVVRNQWLRLLERNFVVIITQQVKKENSQTFNGPVLIMVNELKLVLNVLKQ